MRFERVWPPIAAMIATVMGLEVIIRTGWVSHFVLPLPSDVCRSLLVDRVEWVSALWETGVAAVLGLLSSFVLGTSFAVALSLSSWARRAFLPYAVFFQTVPIIAIAPLLVIWFGFGLPTTLASALVVSFFPIVATTLTGLQSTDPGHLDLFRLYNASAATRLWRLQIPSALPYIFSGLRIAAGLAVIGAIVGEFVAGGGLGAMVDVARTQQRLDKVFAAVLLSTLLGWSVISVINQLSHWSLRHWHASEKEPT